MARAKAKGRTKARGSAPVREPSPRPGESAVAEQKESNVVEIPSKITVRDLAEKLGKSPVEVIKVLMSFGVMAPITQEIDFDTASIVAEEFGIELQPEGASEEEEEQEEGVLTLRQKILKMEKEENLKPRPPVVAVLGHVDHGKTTLLDAIRNTRVAEKEAGGITQHIGAYQVRVGEHKITFLDTPGHAAFTAMRARGAQATDIAIIVVAADDGVMPQTKEAINHVRAAQVPIIVALNKIDKPEANPDRVKQQLADLGLVPEDWGGDTIVVPISAKKRIGLDELLENILLVAEVHGIKANPKARAMGTVLEGMVEKGRGPVATLLVQNGTLHVGDFIVAGEAAGRVRAMFDDRGKPIKKARPSQPVQVMGLSEVPTAGDIFEAVESLEKAREIARKRKEARLAREAQPDQGSLSLEELYERFREGSVKELRLIIRADVQGSIDPIIDSLKELSSGDLKIRVLHAETGNVTESDVMLAMASKAIIIGFNVGVDPAARKLADKNGVDIRLYDVIYKLVEDVDKALKGMLEPEEREVVIGHARVQAVFKLRQGTAAGCLVTDGVIRRNANIRVLRNGEEIFSGKISSLKRFKENVNEVKNGFECGVTLEGFNDFQEGDILEAFQIEKG